MKLTRTGIVGDGAGDDEDSGTDGSADAEKDEIEEAEAANKAVAAGDQADGGGFRLRRRQGLGSESRGPEMRQTGMR